MNELFYPRSFGHWALSLLARLYIRFLGLTSRINIRGRKDHPGPAVYALWHRQEVLMIWLHRNRGLVGLVSQSKDGEYMARILLGMGFNVIRGSSTTGGTQALRALTKAAMAGYSIAVTPDGPKGPVFKVHPGVIFIAQKAGVPIIPAACALSNKKVLRSWDRYQFPLPFGRIEAVYGEPFTVAESDDAGAAAAELERRLNALTQEAEALLAAGA